MAAELEPQLQPLGQAAALHFGRHECVCVGGVADMGSDGGNGGTNRLITTTAATNELNTPAPSANRRR